MSGYCRFDATDGHWQCLKCGRTATIRSGKPPVAQCNDKPTPGLGDIVAACLSALGLTKERVSRWLGYDCGCAKRQARWNELGWHFVAIVRRRIGIG